MLTPGQPLARVNFTSVCFAGAKRCCCLVSAHTPCTHLDGVIKAPVVHRPHAGDNSAACLQAQFQALETRARQAQETLTQQEAEAVKLEQRLAAAREQYDSGLSKLRSTARQLESLASQARQNLHLQLRPGGWSLSECTNIVPCWGEVSKSLGVGLQDIQFGVKIGGPCGVVRL